MTATSTLELRTFTTVDPVRNDLVDVYADVRAPLLHLPNYAVTAFGERLDRHGAERASWQSSPTQTAFPSATPTQTRSSTVTGTGNARRRHPPTSTPNSRPRRSKRSAFAPPGARQAQVAAFTTRS